MQTCHHVECDGVHFFLPVWKQYGRSEDLPPKLHQEPELPALYVLYMVSQSRNALLAPSGLTHGFQYHCLKGIYFNHVRDVIGFQRVVILFVYFWVLLVLDLQRTSKTICKKNNWI